MYEFLKRFRGLKRVDNYIKAYKVYLERLKDPDLSREEQEALLLDKEREKEVESDKGCETEPRKFEVESNL